MQIKNIYIAIDTAYILAKTIPRGTFSPYKV